MLFVETVEEVRESVRRWRKASERVALVPTMGSLHEGHLRLIDLAHTHADRVVVTIFVNPLQFGPNEDFGKYPRALPQDRALLTTRGADVLFYPSVATMYPTGFDTALRAGKLAAALCGPIRPGHFDGVLTVVMKLFTIVGPDVAIFGEKDFQQLRLIETMVRDFALSLQIVRATTTRDEDGLAMSSRNRYLDEASRAAASAIPRALDRAVAAAKQSGSTVGTVAEPLATALRDAAMNVEFAAVVSEDDLVPVSPEVPVASIARPRLFLAARHAGVRLIDNRLLAPEDVKR